MVIGGVVGLLGGPVGVAIGAAIGAEIANVFDDKLLDIRNQIVKGNEDRRNLAEETQSQVGYYSQAGNLGG